jgi:hypothetical protein
VCVCVCGGWAGPLPCGTENVYSSGLHSRAPFDAVELNNRNKCSYMCWQSLSGGWS